MTETHNSLCPLPWLHLSANTDTSLRVCCNTDHGAHIRDEKGEPLSLNQVNGMEDYFNNSFMRGLRRQMMNDERPRFCGKCYDIEDSGATSLRQIYLKQFGQAFESRLHRTSADGAAPIEISYVDFSLSNNCNLRCRMCGPLASYSLKADFEALALPFSKEKTERAYHGWKVTDQFRNLMSQVLPTTEELLLTGGEPFLSPEHQALLEQAVEMRCSRNITLRYHTNLTSLPKKVVALWKHFKRIEVHGSIEAFGSLNEYIRYPSRWETVVKNFQELIELKRSLPLWFEIHTCFQALNVLRLNDLLDFLMSYRAEIPAFPFMIWLDSPGTLAAKVLPQQFREQVAHQTHAFLDRKTALYAQGPFKEYNLEKIKMLESHVTRLLSCPEEPAMWAKFKWYNAKFDQLRGQKLEDLIPELKEPASTPHEMVSEA